METYRRQDPPTTPKLAVPVAVAIHAGKYARRTRLARTEAIADLVNIAFYFLLRVGEYTYSNKKARKRTQQFRIRDITLWNKKDQVIPNTASLHELKQAQQATMRISNQKNGTRGQAIHHFRPQNHHNTFVDSLAHRIHHIMQNTTNINTPISAYFPNNGRAFHVFAGDINHFVKKSVKILGYVKNGFLPRFVSSHSLRAGGAMAMKLNGVDSDTIKKFGRWSSDTFLMYIHEQVSAVSAGVSTAMSNNIHFHNIAGPTLREPEH